MKTGENILVLLSIVLFNLNNDIMSCFLCSPYGFICYCHKCGNSQAMSWRGLGNICCPCSNGAVCGLIYFDNGILFLCQHSQKAMCILFYRSRGIATSFLLNVSFFSFFEQ